MAGTLQAGFFNPFDRALYLSVKNHVPFMTKSNFAHPYQGFGQSILCRALSGGLYYPLENYFSSLVPLDSGPWANFLAGTAAGMTNALLLNPITAVKYKTWSRDVSRGMIQEAGSMWRKGGIKPFTNGLYPTLCRDVVFGGMYTYLRLEFQWYGLPPQYQWAGNMVAAALATILSGPLNLARNVQYATLSRRDAPTIQSVFQKLRDETYAKTTNMQKWQHVQSRLRIGWGTARVAVGMAFGQFVYEELMWIMAQEQHQQHQEVEKLALQLQHHPTRRPVLVHYNTKLRQEKEAWG